MSMDRREAIKRTALMMGGLVFAPSALGVLNGCQARGGGDWNPENFNRSQADLISTLSDVILPATDTPGATDVGVPAFVEEMVFTAYDEDARDTFMSGLEAFNQLARDEYGSDFIDLTTEDQYAFASDENRLAVGGDYVDPGTAYCLEMKELTMLGFFTSERGAKDVLQYVKVQGRYEACIPLAEAGNGKTWAI